MKRGHRLSKVQTEIALFFFFGGGGGGFVPQGKYFLKGMFRELCYLCLAQVEI